MGDKGSLGVPKRSCSNRGKGEVKGGKSGETDIDELAKSGRVCGKGEGEEREGSGSLGTRL